MHWLTSTRFSPFSARWTKFLRGYVSKSSAALDITQLACERPRGRSRTALDGPAHQLAMRMRIIIASEASLLGLGGGGGGGGEFNAKQGGIINRVIYK